MIGSDLWPLFCVDTNRTRLVRKARPTESFFNFFTPPPPIDEDADIDEDDIEEIDEKLEMDYQIGEDFKEKVCCMHRISKCAVS